MKKPKKKLIGQISRHHRTYGDRDEKPVRVISHPGKHKTETRVFARDIHESYCAQKGCKFFGKHAAQGVCHTQLEDMQMAAYYDHIEKAAVDHVAFIKKHAKNHKDYVRHLETEIICNWMNHEFGLDGLIRLRIENALLRRKAGKYK